MLKQTAMPDLEINELSNCDDTLLLKRAMDKIRASDRSEPTLIDVGNCGTAFRFLLPYLSSISGIWKIISAERMKKRPVKPLIEVLRSFGANITISEVDTSLLTIKGNPKLNPVSSFVDISESSQFLSSILLSLPLWKKNLEFTYKVDSASVSYLKMTVILMQKFGIQIYMDDKKGYINYKYSNLDFVRNRTYMEKDWSSAAFWWVWAALSKSPLKLFLKGLQNSEMQSDVCVQTLFSKLGVKSMFKSDGTIIEKKSDFTESGFFEMDGRNNLDLIPLLVVYCILKRIISIYRGVGTLEFKESKRISALCSNLSGFANFTFDNGDLKVEPLPYFLPHNIYVKTYSDHRIAMSMALFYALGVDVKFDEYSVVSKSYPDFWQQIDKVRHRRE